MCAIFWKFHENIYKWIRARPYLAGNSWSKRRRKYICPCVGNRLCIRWRVRLLFIFLSATNRFWMVRSIQCILLVFLNGLVWIIYLSKYSRNLISSNTLFAGLRKYFCRLDDVFSKTSLAFCRLFCFLLPNVFQTTLRAIGKWMDKAETAGELEYWWYPKICHIAWHAERHRITTCRKHSSSVNLRLLFLIASMIESLLVVLLSSLSTASLRFWKPL